MLAQAQVHVTSRADGKGGRSRKDLLPVHGSDLRTEKCFTSEVFCYTFMMHYQQPSKSQSRSF